ncbi:MAG TPA: hypothetical protein PKA20_18745 [Burkholderiaceae bacterium]|nr:hypothetical protein [Burkholderiaceae bacterium]
MRGDLSGRIERILQSQRAALAAGDLPGLLAANDELTAALAELRASPRAVAGPEGRRLRLALRAQGELVARAHAATHRALDALGLAGTPSSYGGRSGRAAAVGAGTHVVA